MNRTLFNRPPEHASVIGHYPDGSTAVVFRTGCGAWLTAANDPVNPPGVRVRRPKHWTACRHDNLPAALLPLRWRKLGWAHIRALFQGIARRATASVRLLGAR